MLPLDRFDAQEYWESRLSTQWDLATVGDPGLGLGFNQWMYRAREQVFRAQVLAVTRAGCIAGSEILDIGSGTGFYYRLWKDLGGTTVTASDFTSAALANLRRTDPEGAFLQLDITAPKTDLDAGPFDIVSAFDMLFHIVDDDAYRAAIGNVAYLLKPGGLFFFTDLLLTTEGSRHTGARRHVVWRELAMVERTLAAHKLQIVDRRPVFVLMNTPIDSEALWRHLWWSLVGKTVRTGELASRTVGRLLFPLEMRLLAAGKWEPSVRAFVCRKTDG